MREWCLIAHKNGFDYWFHLEKKLKKYFGVDWKTAFSLIALWEYWFHCSSYDSDIKQGQGNQCQTPGLIKKNIVFSNKKICFFGESMFFLVKTCFLVKIFFWQNIFFGENRFFGFSVLWKPVSWWKHVFSENMLFGENRFHGENRFFVEHS